MTPPVSLLYNMYSYIILFVGIAGSVLLITFSGCGLHGQLEYHKPELTVDVESRSNSD
jgi:hypothetical protein